MDEIVVLISVLILGVVFGRTWNLAKVRVLRRQIEQLGEARRQHAQLQEVNLGLRRRLIDAERADDQDGQIDQIPAERQVEILQKIWEREAA